MITIIIGIVLEIQYLLGRPPTDGIPHLLLELAQVDECLLLGTHIVYHLSFGAFVG